jgi:hypothetical protein
MRTLRARQAGFAMPAIFIAVAVAFIAGLNVKGENGATIAESIGLDPGKQTEFAAVEAKQESEQP